MELELCFEWRPRFVWALPYSVLMDLTLGVTERAVLKWFCDWLWARVLVFYQGRCLAADMVPVALAVLARQGWALSWILGVAHGCWAYEVLVVTAV